jgi:hypothetical protein
MRRDTSTVRIGSIKLNGTMGFNSLLKLSIAILLLAFVVKIKIASTFDAMMQLNLNHSTFFKPNLLHLGAFIIFTSYLIFYIYSSKKSSKFIGKSLFLITSSLYVTWIIMSGVGRSQTLFYFIGVFVIFYTIDGKFRNFRSLFISFFAVIVLLFFISIMKEIIVEGKLFANISMYDLYINKFQNRLSQSHIFEGIYNQWPYGLTLKFYGITDIFTFPAVGINRQYIDGNDLGHAFGFIGDNDFVTGVAPTFIGDLYIRFGSIGAVIGMAIIGSLYASYDMIVEDLRNEISVILNALCFPYFLYCTENFIIYSLPTAIIIFLFYASCLIFSKELVKYEK